MVNAGAGQVWIPGAVAFFAPLRYDVTGQPMEWQRKDRIRDHAAEAAYWFAGIELAITSGDDISRG
jgi:hypothetical protein